jgi:hypothetical protein
MKRLRASLQNGVGPRFQCIAAAGRKNTENAINVATSTPPAIPPSFRPAATRLETDRSTHFVGKLLSARGSHIARRPARRLALLPGLAALLLAAPLSSCRKAAPKGPAPNKTGISLAAAALRTSLPAHELQKGSYDQWPTGSKPSRVVVVAHSYTDRTHIAGREAARMLGAAYYRLFKSPGEAELNKPLVDVPDGVAGDGLSTFEEAAKAISDPEVDVVFLGSPIWANPTPVVRKLVEKTRWNGKLVVPFCTHAQQWNPQRLEIHMEQFRKLGARVAKPWVLRFPFHLTESEILRAVWESLPARDDLWWNRESREDPHCEARAAGGDEVETCRVAAGVAWAWTPVPARADGTVYERRPRLASVEAFEIAKREVSVGDYGRGDGRSGEKPPTRVWIRTCRELVVGATDLPIPCVSLDEARDWCADRGMRLPTLAEWTRAARGDSSHPYPWGADFAFDGKHGNFGEEAGNDRIEAGCNREGSSFRSDGFPGLAPPCSFPGGDSRFGLCDMAGNVSEWVLTSGGDSAERAALAGGNWFDCMPEAWAIERPIWFPARMTFDGVGFRCAASAR